MRELEVAQLGRLAAATNREHYTYAERMYNERINRLRVEITAMTKEAADGAQQ